MLTCTMKQPKTFPLLCYREPLSFNNYLEYTDYSFNFLLHIYIYYKEQYTALPRTFFNELRVCLFYTRVEDPPPPAKLTTYVDPPP